MARKIRKTIRRVEREPLTDILGGVWLVTLMLSLLHLPALIA
ncbi:hypothetical protein [Jannaschia sp. M317]|nr:hypothetical protein [Jannaschia sp. M317]